MLAMGGSRGGHPPPPVKSRVGFHRNTGTDFLEGGSYGPLSNTLMAKKEEKERCLANSGDPETLNRRHVLWRLILVCTV